ncbi:DUF2505 family protein [Streptomyces vinaceus]|uniref:DUF2505 family protein n=1 Tax=Streptomyces vinaceus TaxID=1960 RepID=UPI0036977C1A
MTKFSITLEVAGTPNSFFDWFLAKDREDDLYTQTLKYERYKITEHRETDTEVLRRVAMKRDLELPGPIARVLGPGYSETEEGRFNKTDTYSWALHPSTNADQIRQEATLRAEATDNGNTKLTIDYDIEVKVFGVGAQMESYFDKNARQEWKLITGLYTKQATV